ncbi:MAG: tRNA pseudouridine(55) synthase TruB [Desulfuromonadales bacterium]
MNGLLLIDKPAGLSSFDVVRTVRRLTGTRKVGHAGTLDPLATGVLPVAIGQATRLLEYLTADDKVYRATMCLGRVTDTQDREGRVLAEASWGHVDRSCLEAAAAALVGEIEQVPPMYSALKKNGQPLYRLAREGITVDRPPRKIRIASLDIETVALPEVIFKVCCSKGTYVRTLCHDIGQALGCGAHMTALRRLACGRFKIADCHPLDELVACRKENRPLPLLSPSAVLSDWPALAVHGVALQRLENGIAPALRELSGDPPLPGENVRLLNNERLVAVAQYHAERLSKSTGDFEILKVFPGSEEAR